MLLEKLREYSEHRKDLAPLGYAEAWVRYEVHLTGSGELVNPEPIDLADAKTKRGQRRQAPQITRTSGVKPLLLNDNAEYTFGLPRQEEDPDKQASRAERTAASHAAYMELLEECAASTELPAVQAVLTFLRSAPLDYLRLPADYDVGGAIAFRVDGRLVTDLPAVRRFWADWALGDESTEPAGDEMQCLICGRRRPTLRRLPGNIKGISGGQPSGMALISANAKAFESYGLENSQTSPVCLECADAFTKAINTLIRDDRNSYKLAGLAFLYWTREPVEFDLNAWFRDPDQADVGALLRAYRAGGPPSPVDETAFYAVSLSANAARVVVRDWIDTTVGDVKRGLARWFQRQQIVDGYGQDAPPLGLYALAAATVRDPSKDLPVTTPRTLLRAALTGQPLPNGLLHQAIRRNHAERDVTRPRAALIKLILLSQDDSYQEDDMVKLQPDHPEPGYHCGRLLAALEQAQRAALGDINQTIVDRFYGTASTAPASVFGRLLRGAQPHLSKLERDAPGTAYALQRTLEDILGALDAFPRTLTLKEQAFFALGYYHQRAFNRAQAHAAAERRRDAKAAEQAAQAADV